jgi:predicted dehydrogenase
MTATSTERNDARVRVALIGPGRISIAHLEASRAGRDVADLAAIVGVPGEEERVRELSDKYGAEQAVIGAETVFRDPAIDAVILTVPNHLHASLAIAALKHGKHVLIEKPLATSLADGDAMIAAAAEAGRILMVAQCRRYFKGAQVARERIAELGRPLNITHILGVYTLEPRAPWWKSAADTGGLVFGLNGPHLVDTALWLIGARPTRVYAQTQRFRDGWEGEDEAAFIVSFEDGSTLTGRLSESTRPPTNESWIIGPNGTMKLVEDRNLWLNGEQIVCEPLRPYIDGDPAFEAQFREFIAAIREGRQPQASAEEVRGVTQVIEAARLSAAQDRAIELSNSPGYEPIRQGRGI